MKLTLTLPNIIALYDALRALDGYEQVVEGRAVRVPFMFGAANFKIARNLNKLAAFVTSFNEARNKLIMELSGGAPSIDISTDPSAARRFMQASAQWETMTEELDLIPLTEDELNLRINPITPGVLAVLDAAGLIIPETDEAQSPRPTLVRG